MSEPGATDNNQENANGFSREYVKQLRDEAASWRVKYRELEARLGRFEVDRELLSRGIQADPKWVEIKEGQSVKEAVDEFAVKYPHLVKSNINNNQQPPPGPEGQPNQIDQGTRGQPKQTPSTLPPNTRVSTGEHKSTHELLQARKFNEIKKDPAARAQLRETYRSLLRIASNQPIE